MHSLPHTRLTVVENANLGVDSTNLERVPASQTGRIAREEWSTYQYFIRIEIALPQRSIAGGGGFR